MHTFLLKEEPPYTDISGIALKSPINIKEILTGLEVNMQFCLPQGMGIFHGT